MRTFIAIDITPTPELLNLREYLEKNLTGLFVRYTETNAAHITLAFLGETKLQQVETVSNELKKITIEADHIEILLSGLGVFKNLRVPQVIWAGIKHNELLQKLWEKINLILKENDIFSGSGITFSPHLTLGRIKKVNTSHNLAILIEKFKDAPLGRITLRDLTFYQSILTSGGPQYIPICKIDL